MAQGRLNRDQFFEKLAEMEATDLKKALWTLYWRGAAPLRERIEAIIDPQSTKVRDRGVKSPPVRGSSWERSRSLLPWRGRVPTWPVIAACRGRSGHGGGTRSID